MKIHPILGIDTDQWTVTNYPATVELTHKVSRRSVCIPKPYDPQPPEWWREQATAVIAEAAAR